MIIKNDSGIKSGLLKIFKQELSEIGYDVSTLDKDDKILYTYFVMCRRLIKSKKRKVYKSDVFTCPIELTNALEILEMAIENGDNINPYLSRRMKDVQYNDKFLFSL